MVVVFVFVKMIVEKNEYLIVHKHNVLNDNIYRAEYVLSI